MIQHQLFEHEYQYGQVMPSYQPNGKPKLGKIKSSKDAYDILKPFYEEQMEYREKFYILSLDRANNVIGVTRLTEGGTSGVIVDVKMLMQILLINNASGVILSHNHPSGVFLPSTADINMTKRVKQAAEIMDIKLLDHIILSTEGYYSFADEGTI